MSTREDRAQRAKHKIQPVKIKVRQTDGSVNVQTVDADVRQDKRGRRHEERHQAEYEEKSAKMPLHKPRIQFYSGALVVGAVYLVRGGHLLRYQGLHGSGPCLAFSPIQDGVPPVSSHDRKDVLQPISTRDLPWIRDRHEQMVARKLDVSDIDCLIDLLTASLEKP